MIRVEVEVVTVVVVVVVVVVIMVVVMIEVTGSTICTHRTFIPSLTNLIEMIRVEVVAVVVIEIVAVMIEVVGLTHHHLHRHRAHVAAQVIPTQQFHIMTRCHVVKGCPLAIRLPVVKGCLLLIYLLLRMTGCSMVVTGRIPSR